MANSARVLPLFIAVAAVPWAAAYDSIKFLPPVKTEDVAKPAALAASAERYYVVDHKKNALYLFDAEGKLMKSVGRAGSQMGSFSSPKGLAIDREGRVYVADTGNSRVQVLDSDGAVVGGFGVRGSDPGQLKNPEGVAVGQDGRVYVADTGNDRVQAFTREGVFLFGFGLKGKEPGKFSGPSRVFVDAADFIYVLDAGNERIQKFSPQTRFVKEFNLLGSDFALDPYGFFYILDPRQAKVREMGPAGVMLGALGSKGTGPGQFKEAAAVALAPNGTILVLDPGNSRIQPIALTNKLKTQPIAASTEAKLLVSGPKLVIQASASALAAGKDLLYAYLPKEGVFQAFDAEGKASVKFGTKAGKGDNVTRGSKGLAAAEGGIFVSDTDGDRVQHFDAQGEFKAVFAQSSGIFDSKKKEGRVKSPQGVAVSGQGMVYVCNTGNRRVDAFNPDGTFLFSIGPTLGSQDLQEPVGVAWDPSGYVYILDRGLKKVFKAEPSGGFLMAWGGTGTGVQELQDPVSMAFDGKSYVYVLDQKARRVSVFTTSGTWVTNFFGGGQDERSLQSPAALAVRGEELAVADAGGKGRILAFALHPILAPPALEAPAAAQGTVSLSWKRSPDAWAAKDRVLRSSVGAQGPFVPLGEPVLATLLQDTDVSAYKSYWYRVATLAETGDEGPASAPAEVLVPGAFNRAPIELASVEIGNIHSANYKYYEKNPVGKAVLVNNVNLPFQNVKVSFRLKDFMDFGTDTVVPEIKAEEKLEIPLKAVLNNRILAVTEDTPIQAEFTVTYFEEGKAREVSLAKPLRVYSRNAITWDKPERIATFVTSNDTPIVEFQKKVANEAKPLPKVGSTLDQKLVAAMRLWNALGAAGVKFQPAANNPFEMVSEDPAFPVDYTQFPRDTLRLKSGECDDLATLTASLLEQAGVQAALLDYPGHLALMFDTGQSDPLMVGLPEGELVRHNDTLWVPLEPTLAGASFSDSHRHAVNAYRQMEKKGKASIIDLDKAVLAFEPATMPEAYEKPDIPKPEEVARRLEADVLAFAKARYEFARDFLKGELAKDGKNVEAVVQWGILELEQGRLDAAAEQFGRALAIDPGDAAALNNLGSLAFLQKDYPKAEEWFLKAAAKDPDDPGIWLNLAKCAAKSKAPKFKEYADKAVKTASSVGADIEAEMKTAVGALR